MRIAHSCAAIIVGLMTLSKLALSADEPFELRYRFQQRDGVQSPHVFVLRWKDAGSNLSTIEVIEPESNKVLQSLDMPADKVHLIWQDLVPKKNQVKDKIVDFIDYNFDQYGDLRLTQSWPYKPGGKYYLIWLFDHGEDTYKFSEELSRLPAPSVDQKAKRIYSTTFGNYGGGEFVSDTYSVAPDGKLILETKVTQKIVQPEKLKFLREVQTQGMGEPRLMCRIEIPAEGRPRCIWGKAEACETFMRKAAPFEPAAESTTVQEAPAEAASQTSH